MQTVSEKPSSNTPRPRQVTRRAAEAVLREHPDALIFAQSSEGHIVPIPDSLGLAGYPVLADEGRTGVDLRVAEDRIAVVNAWMELKRHGIAEVRARLRSDPGTWRSVRMLDLRRRHGVVLTMGWVSDDQDDSTPATTSAAASTTPRFCTRKQDGEGNVLACDEAYLQMFGFSHEADVVGAPTFERVHPEDQARLIEAWIAMVATARPQIARVRMRRHDGSWLWVDTTYHNYLDEHQGGYVLAECIDVSAEMAAQEALQDREELLRHLLEEMPDGLLQVDRDGRVAYGNARLLEMLGTRPLEQPPQTLPAARQPAAPLPPLEDLLSGVADPEPLRTAMAGALEAGEGADVELEVPRPGSPRHILFKVRPLLRDGELITGAIVSVQDVTDLARARRDLERRASTDL